ncbi:MAG: hypothetical protein D6677_00300 [Calditrichaeota bacterium]|nr:MAG: hypothetical protein D6677_00300 [Calditrichota bacterium]
MLHIEPTALDKIREILHSMPGEVIGVRVTADADSPFRIDYGIQPVFPEDIAPDEQQLDFDGIRVFISAAERPWFENVRLTYEVSTDLQGFRFSTPDVSGGSFKGTFAEKVQHVIQTQINPAIARHGGIISVVDIRENNVYVEMGGNCQGCSLSFITLKNGVINGLKEAIPEIGEVIDATDHEAGTHPYYG